MEFGNGDIEGAEWVRVGAEAFTREAKILWERRRDAGEDDEDGEMEGPVAWRHVDGRSVDCLIVKRWRGEKFCGLLAACVAPLRCAPLFNPLSTA